MVNLSTGAYYSLLGAACDAWLLFEQGATLGETAATLATRFDRTQRQVEEDLERFADALIAEGISRLSDQPGKTAKPAELYPVSVPYKAPELEVYRDMEELLALDPPMPGLRDVPWTSVDGKPSKS